MVYDPVSKSDQKNNAPLVFQRDLFLDRYMHERREEVGRRRQSVNALRADLAALRARLKGYLHVRSLPRCHKT